MILGLDNIIYFLFFYIIRDSGENELFANDGDFNYRTILIYSRSNVIPTVDPVYNDVSNL